MAENSVCWKVEKKEHRWVGWWVMQRVDLWEHLMVDL
jgi:hypothetical protein